VIASAGFSARVEKAPSDDRSYNMDSIIADI